MSAGYDSTVKWLTPLPRKKIGPINPYWFWCCPVSNITRKIAITLSWTSTMISNGDANKGDNHRGRRDKGKDIDLSDNVEREVGPAPRTSNRNRSGAKIAQDTVSRTKGKTGGGRRPRKEYRKKDQAIASSERRSRQEAEGTVDALRDRIEQLKEDNEKLNAQNVDNLARLTELTPAVARLERQETHSAEARKKRVDFSFVEKCAPYIVNWKMVALAMGVLMIPTIYTLSRKIFFQSLYITYMLATSSLAEVLPIEVEHWMWGATLSTAGIYLIYAVFRYSLPQLLEIKNSYIELSREEEKHGDLRPDVQAVGDYEHDALYTRIQFTRRVRFTRLAKCLVEGDLPGRLTRFCVRRFGNLAGAGEDGEPESRALYRFLAVLAVDTLKLGLWPVSKALKITRKVCNMAMTSQGRGGANFTISTELLVQICVPAVIKSTIDAKTLAEKLEYYAQINKKVNVNRYSVLDEHVVQTTVRVGYGLHQSVFQKLDVLPFPKSH